MVTGTATLGGTLNVSGNTSGSVIDLMNYSSRTGTFAIANVAFGQVLQYNATQFDPVQTFPKRQHLADPVERELGDVRQLDFKHSVPNGRSVGAEINLPTTGPINITLDGPQTVGALLLGNSASSTTGYTISAGSGGILTLDNSGTVASIVVTGGSHVVSAPLVLAAGLEVTPSGRRDADDQRQNLANRQQRADA